MINVLNKFSHTYTIYKNKNHLTRLVIIFYETLWKIYLVIFESMILIIFLRFKITFYLFKNNYFCEIKIELVQVFIFFKPSCLDPVTYSYYKRPICRISSTVSIWLDKKNFHLGFNELKKVKLYITTNKNFPNDYFNHILTSFFKP